MTDKVEQLKKWMTQAEINQGIIEKSRVMSERLDIVVERVDRVVKRVDRLTEQGEKRYNQNDIPQFEWTEMELRGAIHSTRQEKGGISIDRIADIIAEKFDWSELESLAHALRMKVKEK